MGVGMGGGMGVAMGGGMGAIGGGMGGAMRVGMGGAMGGSMGGSMGGVMGVRVRSCKVRVLCLNYRNTSIHSYKKIYIFILKDKFIYMYRSLVEHSPL